jgi:hypothetical protein
LDYQGIEMNILIFALATASWIAGGQKGKLRDIPFPILIGWGIFLAGHLWLAIACCATFNIIRLGYGNYSPEDDAKSSLLAQLTHDRQGAVIRLIYGLLVALLGALPIMAGHGISVWIYIVYAAGNGLIGYLVSKLRLPVFLADFFVGAGFSSLVFLL